MCRSSWCYSLNFPFEGTQKETSQWWVCSLSWLWWGFTSTYVCQNSSRSTVNTCNRWMSVMPQWSSFFKTYMHSPLRVSVFVSSLTKASQQTLNRVALSSLFCAFHPSFPQSWRTRCAVWACLLPSFCSFFYLPMCTVLISFPLGQTFPSLCCCSIVYCHECSVQGSFVV